MDRAFVPSVESQPTDGPRATERSDRGAPLSICVCARFSPAVGGIESLAEMLAMEWHKDGHRVEIVTDIPANTSSRDWPFEVHRRPAPLRLWSLAQRHDVWLHLNISLKLAWPAALAKARLVASHQSWYCTRQEPDTRREAFKRWIAKRYAANISCSDAVRKSLGCGGDVVPNAYDHRRFRLLREPRDQDLVFVGRLVSDKGVDVLLRALRRLREQGLTPRLTIVGDGPERGPLEATVAEYALGDQVALLGARSHDELPAILNRHRILVVPSLWDEPFGIVALEGAACGCVVAGSAGGGLPDAIGPCGETFPNGDDERLARVLGDLLSDEAGLDRYQRDSEPHLARHRIDVIAQQYIEIFRTALHR